MDGNRVTTKITKSTKLDYWVAYGEVAEKVSLNYLLGEGNDL